VGSLARRRWPLATVEDKKEDMYLATLGAFVGCGIAIVFGLNAYEEKIPFGEILRSRSVVVLMALMGVAGAVLGLVISDMLSGVAS